MACWHAGPSQLRPHGTLHSGVELSSKLVELSQPCPCASACRADVERLAFSVIWEVTPDAEVGWGFQFKAESFTARVGRCFHGHGCMAHEAAHHASRPCCSAWYLLVAVQLHLVRA